MADNTLDTVRRVYGKISTQRPYDFLFHIQPYSPRKA